MAPQENRGVDKGQGSEWERVRRLESADLYIGMLYLLDQMLPARIYGAWVEIRCLSCRAESQQRIIVKPSEEGREFAESQASLVSRQQLEHKTWCGLGLRYAHPVPNSNKKSKLPQLIINRKKLGDYGATIRKLLP